jgi:hypothetical protein
MNYAATAKRLMEKGCTCQKCQKAHKAEIVKALKTAFVEGQETALGMTKKELRERVQRNSKDLQGS